MNHLLPGSIYGGEKRQRRRSAPAPAAAPASAFTDQVDLAARLAALRGDWTPTDYTERDEVSEECVLVISDVHIPYHDEDLLSDALIRAEVLGVEAIVWLGDLLDNPTFSPWGADDLSTNFARELDIAEGLIREAAKIGSVKKQYWSLGNHEERWFRRLGGQCNMTHLARTAGLDDLLRAGTLVVSDNPTLDYHNKSWMLTHPADYSGQPLAVPGQLADKFDRSIVSAHAHHWAHGKSPSGKYTVIESGGAFDPAKVKYVNHRVTRHRVWVQGYVILDHGRAQLFDGVR